MRKILFGSLFLGMIWAALLTAKPAGNWYNNSDQFVLPGFPVTFTQENYHDKIILLPDQQTIEFRKEGRYIVTFTATGIVGTPALLSPGPWSLGLYLNNEIVPGSISATSSGININTTAIIPITGQVILKAEKGDFIQLRNTSVQEVALAGSISNNPALHNTSAAIVIEAIKVK